MAGQPEFEPRFVAMAEVLGELGAEIEALGEVFCRDEGFVARHMRELQAIDLIAQKQRALAAILAAGFSEAEMRRINLEALHERFCGFIDGTTETCCEVPIDAAGRGDPLDLWEAES
ncbi:hypothetical protein [Novosphingobium sp.]|uniref:hypothetical protein n=1 Tax=Novosphingobium sp. TaxID=1874826 RepID=UPI0028A7E015|nr:hypothetical protein [Novosphingobium sp.]